MIKKDLKINKIRLVDIFPSEYNPRKIDDNEFNHLQNSLKEFGLVDPIIINMKNMRIIGGHQRYSVLLNEDKDMVLSCVRFGDIGWVFKDENIKLDSLEDEKALNIALNKIRGYWDEPKALEILNDFKDKGFDYHITGFTDLDIDTFTMNNDDTFFDEEKKLNKKGLVRPDVCFIFGLYRITMNFDRYYEWQEMIESESESKSCTGIELIKEKLEL